MGYGWESGRVRLAPLDREKHFDNALLWLNDPELTRWMLIGYLPLTRLREEIWFDNAMRGADNTVNFAIETLEGQHIGFSGVMDIDWRHGTAKTGSIIGPREFQGKGYGTEAAKLRTRWAFETLGIRLLLAEVIAANTPSLKMLANAGYRECGRIPRKIWSHGEFRDVVIMAALRDEFEPNTP